MGFDTEKLQGISAIYRYVYKNQGVHRNTLRNELLKSGKIASKAKFTALLESLIALGKLKLDKENVSLSSQIMQVGILQKEGNNFFVITPTSKKHFPVNKSVAAGYKTGDVLDIIIDYYDKNPEVVVLGKSQKEFQSAMPSKKAPTKTPAHTQTLSTPQIDGSNSLLGRVVKLSHDELVFIPNNKNFPLRQIPILNDAKEMPTFQNRICVMRLENMDTPLLGGTIIEAYGMAGNPIHEIEAIAKYYNSIIDWDAPGLKEEIAALPTEVDVESLDLISEEEAQVSQRGKTVDHRHLPIVTVDPSNCQDMDDAIYSTVDENGDIVVYSAIANITKYIPQGSLMYQAYIDRALTLYTPNMAYGITAEKLATGICCLTENEDRLAIVSKTVIDAKTGAMKAIEIYDSIVRSRKKYAYSEAQQIIDENKDTFEFADLKKKLDLGEELSQIEQVMFNHYSSEIIKKEFDRRKMIKFNSNKEREITLNDDMSSVEDIKVKIAIPYEKVIEHFMLTANESIAKYALDNGIDIIYRIHEEPNPRKVDKAGEFFGLLGIEMVDELSVQSTNAILELVKGTASEEIVNNFLIRMQSRAIYSDRPYNNKQKAAAEDEYSSRPISHYALQSEHYCHFTAGIRRSPDYVTQYNILAHIHGTKPMSKPQIAEVIEKANQRQIDIDHAEKDIADVVSVNLCEKLIGEQFSGRIFKFRYSTALDSTNSEILVIVKNPEKGFFVEIPLSQIIGNKSLDCSISEQGCAVYDSRGNVVLSILKPLDFVIESVDKVALNIVGKTNRAMVNSAEARIENARAHHYAGQNGYVNTKKKRVKRFESKQHHSHKTEHERHERKRELPTHEKQYGEEE